MNWDYNLTWRSGSRVEICPEGGRQTSLPTERIQKMVKEKERRSRVVVPRAPWLALLPFFLFFPLQEIESKKSMRNFPGPYIGYLNLPALLFRKKAGWHEDLCFDGLQNTF